MAGDLWGLARLTGPRIVFLPDYGPVVGGGHVMRSLTLAAALAERGAVCAFAVGEETAQRVATFAAVTVDLWPPDPAAWPQKPNVAVLDNYAAGLEDERALSLAANKLAVLDDLARPHDCDLVIDTGLGRSAADYTGRAAVLAGPSYALVRREFSLAPRLAQPGRVLVSLGLTDVGAITALVVARLLEHGDWSAIDVVLGSGAASLEFVREAAAHDPRLHVHVDSRDMAALSARAEFAIGAGGSSVWERACQALPTLMLILADNQAAQAQRLAQTGAVLAIDVRSSDFAQQLDQSLAAIAGDPDLRASLAKASHDLCDGKGADRVAEAILALSRESYEH